MMSMIFSGLTFLLWISLVSAQSDQTVETPFVDLGYAKYVGYRNETTGLNTFFGMKYAAPPIGNLRWRAPQPPLVVEGIQDAVSQLPYSCPQAIYPGEAGSTVQGQEQIEISEDCLTINVYTPSNATVNSKLPVVVYLHGGGYTLGNNANNAPEAYLDLVPLDVVAVVPNYRLGIFGFLAGDAVKNDGTLNASLLDEQFALQWIQKNIHLFGGDPDHVTLWGESAGAGSVLQHVVANGGKTNPPLFKVGVANSPFFPFQYAYNAKIPTQLFQNLSKMVGCDPNAENLDCLRSVPLIPDLRDANIQIASEAFYGTFTWVPVVDGEFIQERPITALQQKKINGEMLITSHNAHEGLSFADPSITASNFTQYVQGFVPTASKALVEQLVALYPESDYDSDYLRTQSINQDPIFLCSSYALANAFGEKAYKMVWDVLPAYHGQDASYYFTPFPEQTQSFTTFQNWVGDIMSFARFFNPNVARYNTAVNPPLVPWSSAEIEVHFNITATNISVPVQRKADPALLERCAFWWSIGEISGQ